MKNFASTQNVSSPSRADLVGQSEIPLKAKCRSVIATTHALDFDALPDSAFVRLPNLLVLFACSRATIWRWVKNGLLPAPKKVGPRVTAWSVAELRQVLSARMGSN